MLLGPRQHYSERKSKITSLTSILGLLNIFSKHFHHMKAYSMMDHDNTVLFWILNYIGKLENVAPQPILSPKNIRYQTFATYFQRISFQIIYKHHLKWYWQNGPRQANLVLIAYASSEGSGEPAHPRSLARTSAARSYKQWVKRNLQTENQLPGPFECLGMRS